MLWHVMPNYIDMMYSVLLQCSVNAEIRAVDSQSDLRIIIVMINSDIYLFVWFAEKWQTQLIGGLLLK